MSQSESRSFEHVRLEACIASVEDAIAARDGGADRLELNVGRELGGLTPSVGLLEEIKRCVDLPVVAMVRPRAAGFRYHASDLRVMLRDAESLLASGADGIVAGALQDDGKLNQEFWKQLVGVTAGRDLVFHRAIDVVDDQALVLRQLMDFGTTRVLTSGGSATAWEGRNAIAELCRISANQVEIIAGSGVGPDNARQLAEATGCTQLHGSFSETSRDGAGSVADAAYPVTCERLIAATRDALDASAAERG